MPISTYQTEYGTKPKPDQEYDQADNRGNDPWRELPAGDLDRDQKGAEREHQERKGERDDRLVQARGAGRGQRGQLPVEPAIEQAQQASVISF